MKAVGVSWSQLGEALQKYVPGYSEFLHFYKSGLTNENMVVKASKSEQKDESEHKDEKAGRLYYDFPRA